ncbi:1-deoxy-D-xylulose-5-phosphate synthase [Quadrisphaera oryzae]|uniref:1-deoxy-D-xylulose-5-phosphate synthase n=1 Tax=Quadrisphaera TaxID=317661 RepID=UPI0016476F33|nr:1-deoxy-D-xylulose-5-phosphate synthase [Quadrisphaera sp. RL12-1S]
MGLLPQITSPRDLRRLSVAEVRELADEVRTFLVREVSRTGGHLGPNLGVVELTLAIHRTFDSPRDAVVFDTGHQSYVHKLLTGRQDFSGLRKRGGLAGYPSREESAHDVVENSHASTSLSWAHGIAQGFALQGQADRHVVAVIGDGALTGGMAWEALNNIAADADRRLVVVVNDNGRSYAPTIGGMAHHLATLRTTRGYERFLEWGKATLARGGAPGRMAYDTLHGMKKGLKDFVAPQGLFEDLGMKYIGPVDGHDVEALEHALGRAKAFGGPVIVHAMTRKGNGFSAAETDEADRFHAVGVIDPDTGQSLAPAGAAPTWTKVFAEEMVEVGRRRADVVGITAAMLIPVGLHRFAAEHPDRVIDVGIAEQHATTAAAGLAYTGLHPVVAVYSTFLNRAFDQVLLDVALHRAGVTFVLDRAGITGDDGPSHHGIWDMSLLAVVPGLRLAAPRDAATLREELAEALDVDDAPTVLRFSKGAAPESVPALERVGGAHGVDVLARTGSSGTGSDGEPAQRDVLVVAVGAFAPLALEVAERLAAHGISATVVDPRWVLPVHEAVVDLARGHRLVLTVEDGVRTGGVGACTTQALADAGVEVPVSVVGVPVRFWEHGSRAQVLAAAGLTAQDIARGVAERVAGLPPAEPAGERPGAPLAERS